MFVFLYVCVFVGSCFCMFVFLGSGGEGSLCFEILCFAFLPSSWGVGGWVGVGGGFGVSVFFGFCTCFLFRMVVGGGRGGGWYRGEGAWGVGRSMMCRNLKMPIYLF